MVSPWRLARAGRFIEAGGIVAYPTEAVYGLGCDPLDPDAVRRLLDIKHRPLELGLILIAAQYDQLIPYIGKLGPQARARLERSWPGPHTWLVPASPRVPPWIRGAHAGVAVRVTAHPIAAALCDAAGTALVSTSANVHGGTPARSALGVRLRFGDEIDFVLGGDTGGASRPTEIRDAVSGKVVRAG